MGEAMTNLELTFYQDGGNKVPIPAGFAVSQVEGENTVEDGLVIIDSEGNEFVWVPCDNVNTYVGAGNYSKSTENSGKGWSEYDYTNKNWTNTDIDGTDNTETKRQSISKYKGFYVARFEAGVPSNASNFYVSSDGWSKGEEYKGKNESSSTSTTGEEFTTTRLDRNDNSLKPVSKRYNQVWNFINQTTAKTVSEKMYKDNNTVDSYLIDSNAWNYICGDIFRQDEILGEEKLKDSTKYGNYYNNTTTDYTSLDCLWAKHEYSSSWNYATKYGKGSITTEAPEGKGNNRLELATGASDDFKLYNIYDMAGNVWEWTEETATDGSTTYGAIRGGSFKNNGNECPVVRADGDDATTNYNVSLGFRPVLYVK